MPTTACTTYYSTTVTGYVAASGDSVGTVVTYTTPKPDYGSATNTTDIQCNAIRLGGFNGLNN